MSAFAFLKENLSEILDIKGLSPPMKFAESVHDKGCTAACSGHEIRDLGLTTPDKPVARRPSTVPAESGNRGTNGRTNVGPASLCTD